LLDRKRCQACGACAGACDTAGLELLGKDMTVDEVMAQVLCDHAFYAGSGGGLTISGGEPLAQAAFAAEVIDQLDDLHVVLDTSGYAEEPDFRAVASRADLIYFDVKLVDPEQHRHHTGASNERIHRNLRVLSGLGVPFVIRVPLIPGVTDTEANLSRIARLVAGMPGLQRVDLLPYNRAAGAKYAACGLKFQPTYDESRPVNPDTTCFASAGLEVRVL
jgi:pyruvate formate lyase activating enzyme